MEKCSIIINARCGRFPNLSFYNIVVPCNIDDEEIYFPDRTENGEVQVRMSNHGGKGKYELELKGVCFDILNDLDKLLDSLSKNKMEKCIAYTIRDGYVKLPLNLSTYISSDPEFEATVFLEHVEIPYKKND